MLMPVYPGAPWLPKFKGPGDDLKYCDWKEQITGLLGTQELTESKKVDIVLGALAGEAKRQVSVLEEDEKDQVRKIFLCLDSLYGDRTPVSLLRSQFFSCTQRPSETVPSFILRLRELYCRLRRHDPDNSPSDTALRDQLLLGLQESPLAQALKVYARRNPEEDFAAIRQEALLLDAEYGNTQTEVTCSSVNNSRVSPKPTQGSDWKETLKQEIMEDVKTQMGGLTQELLREIKSLLQPAAVAPQPSRRPEREGRRPTSYANDRDEQVLDFEVESINIPGRGVVVVKDEHCTHPLIIGMNVVTACWNALFKWPAESVSSPPPLKNQRVWRDAFATCRHVEVTMEEDGWLGYVRPARRRNIRVSPKSEVLVWGQPRMGPRGTDYCALLEALPDGSNVGVARTLAVVRNGRVPVRVCNPHPYSLSIGRYEKLGKLYHVDETDVHGPRDLSFSLEEDGVVEVALVDAAVNLGQMGIPDAEPANAGAPFSAAVELTPRGESEEWADGEWEIAQASDPDIQGNS
ncbi:uncharacterized protein AKAME5_000875900 [Lates japonicus]|uniref:Paraneoplastic antigen Ma-like C-terminal domain-containing protein n=1 Tax=Lates japonicus TaxID=270547 RepID=A0AAD3MMH6_LATJO|nr:uncharacterized protein AKAME5_000875900 [Lates japonicus]